MDSFRLTPAIEQPASISAASHPEYKVADPLRHGHLSIRAQVSDSHPMQKHLSLWAETQTSLKQTMYRKVYGSGLPLVLQLDSATRSQRVLGAAHIHRSSLAQDVMNGRDWDIDFEDYLNCPKNSTEILNPVSVMEHQLGMM